MTKFIKAAIFCLLPMAVSAQDDEQPIITFHSSAYTEVGESNKFSILIGATEPGYYDIDMGAGKNELEVEVANIDASTGEWKGTWVPVRVNAEGVVKIYGDASKIDVLVLDGGYVTDIDMAQCTNLEILSMEHNVLRSLDLTPFTKLNAIYLTDNPFTPETPLVVGAPKPALQILEVDIVDHISPSLNISDYPELVVFDAYHTTGLKAIDPTGCPKLQSLSIEMTSVETIDVTKNPRLTSLNISESRVKTIDLSQNPNLVYLMAGHSSGSINTDIKMDAIDLSHNPQLFFLSLTGNNFTNVDLSKNIKLQNLSLNRNKLTGIDLSANVNLYSVDLSNNDMDIATLPLPQSTWGEYYYLQHEMPVGRVLGVGETLDLSARVLREGTVTTAKVMRKPFTGDPVELDAATYTYADGKISFNKAVADSVYVVFSNSLLNEYNQSTTRFRVKPAEEVGQPSKTVGLNIDGSKMTFKLNVGVAGASESTPKTFIIDFDEGTRREYVTKSSRIDALSEVTITAPEGYHGRPSIYMPEGNDITALALDGIAIYGVDLKAATSLQQLSLTNAEIYSIDLRYNRCLEYLDLSGNNLSELSLLGIYGDYEKNVLHTLKAARNKLSRLDLRDGSPLKVIDLSGNQFAELPMTEFDNVLDLNVADNLLAGELSLAYQFNSNRINVSGNPLTSLKLDAFTALEYFNISNTNLTLATLPLPSTIGCEYVYSPLKPVLIQASAPAVNLTAQNRVVDGAGTEFVWKKADGTVLVQGVDIDCVDGGTRFLNEDLGTVYCEMTNPAFPGLTLSTTQVTVVGAPTNIIATFTATAAVNGEIILRGHKNSALYIDWRGDGTEFMEYPFTVDAIANYNFSSVKGAEAKIYTYGDAADLSVFSIYNVPMSSIDASKLTGLSAFSVGGAGLTAEGLSLPEARLTELNLTGNKLSAFPFADKYASSLQWLTLDNNAFTTFDASSMKLLSGLYLANNKLTSVKFNNPSLWDLHLNGNLFETINLEGLGGVEQLFVNNNRLSQIDLSPVSKTLKALSLVGNSFTFATLPRASEAPLMNVMLYGMQQPMPVECVDGKVDLSSQADIEGTQTSYEWFLGEATLDVDNGVYVGEKLVEGDEFTVENGVTTFNFTFSEKVMCVMSNAIYPNLLLTTERLAVDKAGIEEVDGDRAEGLSGIYDLQGRRVSNPAHGVYIINGRKVLVK